MEGEGRGGEGGGEGRGGKIGDLWLISKCCLSSVRLVLLR